MSKKNDYKGKKKTLSFKGILNDKKKQQNQAQSDHAENAEMQKCKTATEENVALSVDESTNVAPVVDTTPVVEDATQIEKTVTVDTSGQTEQLDGSEPTESEVSQSVPSVPPVPAVPMGQPSDLAIDKSQHMTFEEFYHKLHGVLRRAEGIIPNNANNRFVDLDDPVVVESLAKIVTKIDKEQMEELLKKRQADREEALAKKRQKLECDGVTVILENDELAHALKLIDIVYKKHHDLYSRNESWRKDVQEFRKIKSHLRTEVRNAMTHLDKRDQKLTDYIDKLCETLTAKPCDEPNAIATDTAISSIAPARPTGDDIGMQIYYIFILLPLYKIRCFLTDRYTLAFFHTAILTVIVVLLGLIGFMSHDLAKYRTDAEKYGILRAWLYVDQEKAKDKTLLLDAWFSDEEAHKEEINKLIIRNRQQYFNNRSSPQTPSH